MKTIFNQEKRKELAAIAKEKGITLKQAMQEVRNEETKKKKVSRQTKQQKLVWYKLHHLDAERHLVKKHESAEARFERVVNEKILALNQFAKNANIGKENEAYKDAKKAIESHDKREKMLVERRANRKGRIENAKARVSKEGEATIKHFLKSEEKRKAKREEKRSKYAGKKTKVAPRPVSEEQVKTVSSDLKNYYVVLERFSDDHSQQYDSDPIVIRCSSVKLHKRLAEFHKKHAEQFGDEYIGTYVYNEEKCSHCILESINQKYYNIDGYLTSRMAAQRAAAAA